MSTETLQKEISETVKELGYVVKSVQDCQDKSEKTSASYADEIEKLKNISGDAMQKYQDLQNKIESVEKTNKYIEKSMARNSGLYVSRKDLKDEKGCYFKNISHEDNVTINCQIDNFLRKGTGFDSDFQSKMAHGLSQNIFFAGDQDEKKLLTKSLVVGSDPKGGYWVTPEILPETIQRIFETSPIRQFANVVSTTMSAVTLIIDDDEASSGGWVGEITPRTNTDTPVIGELTIPIHGQFAQPKISEKMLEDSGFDVQSWLNRKVADILSRDENTAFVVGNGSQKPRGFLDYPNWNTPSTPTTQGIYQRGAVEQIPSGLNAAFTADGIKFLKNALIENYQNNAVFGLKRNSWQQITTLKDDVGQYYIGFESFRDGSAPVILGKPVIFMNDMPDIAQDSLSLVYGDFGVGYTIVDRLGIRIIRDELTDKPFIKYYTTKRVGGAVTNYQSIKIQRLAAT